MEEIYFTRSGYEKLFEELDYLKNVKRRQLSKAIGEAIAHGDISENAEYDAAKEAQGLNEKKIAEIEYKLARARIIEAEDISRPQHGTEARHAGGPRQLNFTGLQHEHIVTVLIRLDVDKGALAVLLLSGLRHVSS